MVEARIWARVRIELSRRLNRVVPLIDRFCHRLPRRETAFPRAILPFNYGLNYLSRPARVLSFSRTGRGGEGEQLSPTLKPYSPVA